MSTCARTHVIGAAAVQELPSEEVAVYSISCKNQSNINLVLDWLIAHSKR